MQIATFIVDSFPNPQSWKGHPNEKNTKAPEVWENLYLLVVNVNTYDLLVGKLQGTLCGKSCLEVAALRRLGTLCGKSCLEAAALRRLEWPNQQAICNRPWSGTPVCTCIFQNYSPQFSSYRSPWSPCLRIHLLWSHHYLEESWIRCQGLYLQLKKNNHNHS